MTDLKFCVNCKWCKDEKYCISPKNIDGYCLVTGNKKAIFVMCESHRESEKYGCTKTGLFYEEK